MFTDAQSAVSVNPEEQFTYADGLARLYEFIAGIIDEQQPLVEEHFGAVIYLVYSSS